jgi:protein required for attachment to host cells
MDPIWIVLADEGRARILARDQPGADLVEVEELTDAAAHADNADLRRDAYGRRGGGELADGGGRRMGGNATASAGEEKLDHEAELFARRVAKWLLEAHQKGRYGELRLAAAPRFLGRLRKQIDPQVAKLIAEEVDKDLLHDSPRDVAQRFFPSGS